ncbi:DUF3558 family protein [Nocardia ignorata]|uniref:Uncharacterized protein DUF3558 n=1 Tax=Nocardia ignorata TaxID=145285 RepID=A0A4R6PTV0_NOCIG|nr:DUF3558 family protein [Nocardia ignorata]TDP41952.1 uncharacterized protein DUF3558 [Nocardia ignorata]
MRRLSTIGLGIVVAGTVAGCSGDDPAAKALFEPCAGVGEQALTQAGVDPASRVPAGSAEAGWQTCAWDGATASLRVYSADRSLEEFEAEAGPGNFYDITVAGRAGRKLVDSASLTTVCDVAFGAEQGVVRMIVVTNPGQPAPDACATLTRMGEAIVPALPA